MATQTEDNSGLYFIVGGLVVVVAIIGFLYMNDSKVITPDSPTIIERTERTIEKSSEPSSSNSFELKIDDDGASATTTQNR